MTESSKEVSHNLDRMVELPEKVSLDSQGIFAATEEQVASIREITASA